NGESPTGELASSRTAASHPSGDQRLTNQTSKTRRQETLMRLSRFISVLIAVVCAMLAASHAATCPAENRIIYVANPTGSWQIYSVKPDGTDTQQLTNLAPTDFNLWWPSYSPDGTKIAFAYGPNSDGSIDVFVMNCDGSGLTQITQDGLSLGPRWSHDGKRL